jgi:hypothetical protein
VNSTTQAERLAGLRDLGASAAEAGELLLYNENVFDLASFEPGIRFPLPDEPFVAFWEEVEREARERGAFTVLRERLPQLRFPIRAGISETEGYRAATRRGVPVETIPEATGLELERPEAVEVAIHTSPAGRIPLVIVRRRPEFVAVLQALTRRNEPAPVPDAQGALMVSGYNNWARIRGLGEDFRHLQDRKELYQDRFILLSNGPYSAVPAADLGLDAETWREISRVLRRDHECAHYLTRRLFGSMRNNLLDELIADYAGMVGATGRFRAGWFLRFVGLEDYPRYREGGRLDLYRGKPPLSDGAFRVLHSLVKSAAENLERFDAADIPGPRDAAESALRLAALASLRLEDLASDGAPERIGERVATLRERLGPA